MALVFIAGPALPQGDKSDDPMAPLTRFVGEWQVEGKWASGDPLKARGVYEWGVGKKGNNEGLLLLIAIAIHLSHCCLHGDPERVALH